MDKTAPVLYKVKDLDGDERFQDLHPNLPRPPSCCVLVGSIKSGKCLYEDSIVETNNGNIKLKDVKIGEYVNSINGFIEVLDVIHQGLQTCYLITLENDIDLILTDNHKLQTTDGMKPLKECNDLYIINQNGKHKIKSKKLIGELNCYDLTVDHPSHTFYCSHNTKNKISVSNSNTVINMLMREDMYKNRFDVVRVLSATLHLDKKMMLLDKYFHCDDHYEDKYIDSIVKSQGQYQKDDPNRPKYCLVMDDILSPEFNKRNSALSLFMTKMRHYIDMCIISVQSINHIPPLIRAQTRDLIIAKQQNHKEVIKLMEQYGGLLGENGDKKFIQLYNQVHKDQMYQLMYLKLSENPIHIFKNFNERIF